MSGFQSLGDLVLHTWGTRQDLGRPETSGRADGADDAPHRGDAACPLCQLGHRRGLVSWPCRQDRHRALGQPQALVAVVPQASHASPGALDLVGLPLHVRPHIFHRLAAPRPLPPSPWSRGHGSPRSTVWPCCCCSSRKGSEKNLRGRSAASVMLKALAEDEAVTLKFPHRLLTVSSEGRFVENIGPLEMSALSVSCHGDAWRGQGFCIFEGSAERSGFCTRVGRDATFRGGEDVGESYVSLARRNIAKSRELPDVSEVMKWRAQAGYRTDPVHNSCEIFAREFAYKMEIPSSTDTASHSSPATAPGAPSAGATAISSKTATADIVSGCRLWGWVDRIERLCEEKRRREAFSARGTGLAGLGRRGNRGPSYFPRV
ncbi:unnamed protein product, partial [Ascophyllum nodosum]